MSDQYAAEHAGAYADTRSAGVPITFTLGTQGTKAVAFQSEDDLESYAALELIAGRAITLFAVTETYGDRVPMGAQCAFGGETYLVRTVRAFAPAGRPIYSRVVCAR